MYPHIEAGHIFGRVDRRNRFSKGVRSMEWMWRNALFILETQIMDADLRKRLYAFVHPQLNFNVAKKMIRDHYDDVLEVREGNRLKFINTPKIFTDKFDYRFKV